MADGEATSELVVWVDRDRQDLVREVLDGLGSSWRVLGIGGPAGALPDDLCKALSLSCEADLRKLVIDRPARVVLVASAVPPGEAEILEAAERCDLVVFAELPAERLEQIGGLRKRLGGDGGQMVFSPELLASPGMQAANDPGDLLGEGRLATLEFELEKSSGLLSAGLFQAWLAALGMVGLPEEVSASLVGGRLEGERLLGGSLAVSGRSMGREAVLLAVTDQTGRWQRRMRVIGDGGSLELTDEGYRLMGADGSLIDAWTGEKMGRGGLIAREIKRCMEGYGVERGMSAGMLDRVVACCRASVLSLRTGQSESPEKLLGM
ncbi:hypothetical protein [Mucisphaera sp.]|uniref:hypothetical protein n=1 Tax=Mucisphaera sp. TaxID=2913024 RepID=UPI003D0E0C43